jgi:hypothetical protein
MSVTDDVLDIPLIAIIFRQIRPHQLTPGSVPLPPA